ncbi:MAG: PEGA domain-containing protein, partial [Myxococcales bacterium]|nr:PEGA domain-containing protein [Myxococcales bacterium]
MSRTGTLLVLVGAFSAFRPVHLAAQSSEEPADDVLAGDVLGDVADGDDETGDGEAGDHEAGEEAVGEARAHFRKGVDYYGDGDFASSLLEFERAYKLQPTYRLLFNMGQVAYEQRDYIAAEGYFSKYLVQGGDRIDRQRRDAVEADLRRLRGRIGRMRVRVDRAGARVFIDGKPVGRSPFRAPVRASAGRRSVRAELAGFASVDRSVEVVGGEEVEVSF